MDGIRRLLVTARNLIYINYRYKYFTIEALEDGLTVKLSRNASEYCIDNGEWTSLKPDTATPTVKAGQKISFKITNPTIASNYPYGIGSFIISKQCNVSGNIMSLLYGDDYLDKTDLTETGKSYVFYRLFYNCSNIISAENLVLPATTLADYCYNDMFSGCTGLTSVPELPATTFASYCYYSMFYGCTGLTEAPELPATTLANYCYYYMFRGCTGLTTAPVLPATILSDYCYSNMFENCTSLTTAPELPATTLTMLCYGYMFAGCSKLNYIKMLATNISATDCLINWVEGVSSSGTFVKAASTTTLPAGINGIPNGWTVENV